ncbi:hypothetical protein VTL71DRAFT_14202 [Oculimacula yallundae]|uniref:Heterokaryon incompatibility domain-containing protein n=1 Tax=Oculimacula yallundae TaxID=86028 RepID=A0ABR4CHX3_9HELO
MWLIDTDTLELKSFPTHPEGKYAILSHRWGENEVNFQDWKARRRIDSSEYRKIKRFAKKAAQGGFRYAWADTCCINKESSAELSEAINSMFKLYHDAAECYVYLSDLPPTNPPSDEGISNSSTTMEFAAGIEKCRGDLFAKSKWFTRGWTLQELIAPKKVMFFDSAWKLYGTKHSLGKVIWKRTGVPKAIIEGTKHLRNLSVACRMSWAADRQTTVVEDLAYCLLGIFDIHLPLLYGEGRQAAFVRVQEEICRKTTDMSLFAWTALPSDHEYSGLFATSPANFKHSANVTCWPSVLQTDFDDEIAVTNRGIRLDNISLYISSQFSVLLELNCWDRKLRDGGKNLYVSLIQGPDNRWVRWRADKVVCMTDDEFDSLKSLQFDRIFVRPTVDPGTLKSSDLYDCSILFECLPGITFISAEPSRHWSPTMKGFLPTQDFCGAVHVSAMMDGQKQEEFLIICHVSRNTCPGKMPDWRKAYKFWTLDEGSPHFDEVKEIIQKKSFCIKEDYRRMRQIQNILPRGCCWSKTQSQFTEDVSIGNNYEVTVKPIVVREQKNGDSWDLVKVHIEVAESSIVMVGHDLIDLKIV